MSNEQQYILTTDDDAHWYVIPADKEAEWRTWCEAAAKYWWDLPENQDEPVMPEWAVSIGGAPSLVKFSNYEIG